MTPLKLTRYVLSVVVGACVNILVIPVVIRVAGTEVWAGVAVSQSLGTLLGVLVGFGWGITGPTVVAGLSSEDRGQYYFESVTSRVAMFLVSLPILALLIMRFVPGANTPFLVLFLAGAAPMITSLGAYWFFVGESEPTKLLLFDTLPRAVGAVVGLAAIAILHNVLVFLGSLIIGNVCGVILGALSVRSRYSCDRVRFWTADTFRRLGQGISPLVVGMTSALYVNVPLLMLSVVSPVNLPAYSVADKIQRFVSSGLVPVTQVAQGYIPAVKTRAKEVERIRRVLVVLLFLAVVVLSLFFFLLPLAVEVLSTGEVEVSRQVAFPLSLAVACSMSSGVVGLACLMALGQRRVVAWSSFVGALVGISSCFFLGRVWGDVGVAWGAGLAEMSVVLIELVCLSRLIGFKAGDR